MFQVIHLKHQVMFQVNHLKHQVLFPLKNDEKIFMNGVCCSRDWRLKGYMYSRLSLSRSRRDPLKHFEISVLGHVRCAELRKIPIEQPNFTNEYVM